MCLLRETCYLECQSFSRTYIYRYDFLTSGELMFSMHLIMSWKAAWKDFKPASVNLSQSMQGLLIFKRNYHHVLTYTLLQGHGFLLLPVYHCICLHACLRTLSIQTAGRDTLAAWSGHCLGFSAFRGWFMVRNERRKLWEFSAKAVKHRCNNRPMSTIFIPCLSAF